MVFTVIVEKVVNDAKNPIPINKLKSEDKFSLFKEYPINMPNISEPKIFIKKILIKLDLK